MVKRSSKAIFIKLLCVSTLIFVMFIAWVKLVPNHELTVVGYIVRADGIGRQSYDLINLLKDDVSINFIKTRKNTPIKQIPPSLFYPLYLSNNKPGKVVILESVLPYHNEIEKWKKKSNKGILDKLFPKKKFLGLNSLNREDQIYIAYSMFESNKIIDSWVKILNEYFDMVVVPSPFLIKVYQESGVKIPIFYLPLGINLDFELNYPIKKQRNKIFRFGNLASIQDRKNHIMLVEAFAKLYKNKPDIELIINARSAEEKTIANIKQFIEQNNINNIKLTKKTLSEQEYNDLLTSIDCFVYLSKGEGFSIQPRESMALGVPVIISNNTGQEVIAKSGHTKVVKSEILKPAYYNTIQDEPIGFNYDVKLEDVVYAMQDVYKNYDQYLKKSEEMRNWASSYQYKRLKPLYLTLVKPKEISYSDENLIEDGRIVTKSKSLYEKYRRVLDQEFKFQKDHLK